MEGNNLFNTNTTFDGGNPIGPSFRFANDRGGVHVCSDIVLSGAPWPEFVPTQSLNLSAAANPCSAVTIENNCQAQRSLNHLAEHSPSDQSCQQITMSSSRAANSTHILVCSRPQCPTLP